MALIAINSMLLWQICEAKYYFDPLLLTKEINKLHERRINYYFII